MKLLIEEYQYDVADVINVLDGLFTLQDVEQKVSVNYVGYYYNPHENVKDVVFILPKVLIDENNKVFGKYEPEKLINLDEASIGEHEKKFLYEFAVWIHRAIVVFNDSKKDNKIVLHRQIESEGKGNLKKKSNTLLDVILSLILFNKENQQFFTFIIKNIHSGFNKINWGKTISSTTAMVEGSSPVYLNPVNKKKMVNFDEELIIIFFSILQYISDRFGFRIKIPYGFKLITGNQFERYLKGYGRIRLRQIKYKYFSDTAVKLWDLCYAFFEKSYQIRMNVSQSEYLLVKSFYIVFEAMIDELIGDKDIPKGLKEQEDGKLVDHFYIFNNLLINEKPDGDIYYIGDSKYYKIGSNPGSESVYKQYTYARNVIQWNLNLFLPQQNGVSEEQLNARREDKGKFGNIDLRDDITEGYNIIPNFFISAFIPKNEDGSANLTYQNISKPHEVQPPINRQFEYRLYDRDTLILSHYDINFLFVLSLYARNNSSAKEEYKLSMRHNFRNAIQKMLSDNYEFYAMSPHPDVDMEQYFKNHFQDVLGKTLRPFENKEFISLALDKSDPKKEVIKEKLSENFYVVPIKLGEDPSGKLEVEKSEKGKLTSPDGMGMFLFGIIPKLKTDKDGLQIITDAYYDFNNEIASEFTMKPIPKGDLSKIKYFIPLLNGGMKGYYPIIGYEIKTSSKSLKDKKGNLILDEDGKEIKIPESRIRMELGEYIALGDYIAEIPHLERWNGQIHNYQEVIERYKSFKKK